jgi:uncharacterized protein
MEFTNSFTINAPVDVVWKYMLNAHEVAPCVPGAAITETIDDTHFKGTVRIKLGAVQVAYRGDLQMEPDEATRTVVLQAKGTEQRGSGGASGVITNVLTETSEGHTLVEIHSKIDVTGKVATFGRGIMQDVANKMIREFSACLQKKLEAGAAPTSPGPLATESPDKHAHQESGSSHGQSGGSTSTSSTPTQTEPVASSSAASEAPELKVGSMVVEIVRGRTAAGLRFLASKIEPK